MATLPKRLTIADLGCSSGPNALEAIWEIINVSSNFYQTKNLSLPQLNIFLNDLMGNDFNTLFRSLLPDFHKKLKEAKFGACCESGTPRSFHRRLFQINFLHLVHASSSLHFLSEVPKSLVSEDGVDLDKGGICITNESPPKMHEAYYQQFTDDFTLFLSSRSKKVIRGGQMVLTFRGCTQSDKPEYIWDFQLLGIAFQNLVLQGKIEEEKLDSFNVPFYTPFIEEVQRLRHKGLLLSLKKLTVDWGLKDTDLMLTPREKAKHVSDGYRAATGPIFASQFGVTSMDDLFYQFEDRVEQCLISREFRNLELGGFLD